MLPAVRATLAASPANAILSGRVYRHGTAPQGVTAPYVTWSVSGDADNALDGACVDRFRVQVDCWADTDAGVETLATAVRDGIEPAAPLNSYLINERDRETGRYRISMAFDWIVSR